MRRIDPRQLALIFRFSTRQGLRGGAGTIFLLLVLFYGFILAAVIVTPLEPVLRKAVTGAERAVALKQVVNIARPAIVWAVSPRKLDDPVAQHASEQKVRESVSYLLDGRPALLSAIFLLLLFGMPLLIPFGAHNQTAGDIGSRNLRFVLLRTERPNIYYGRLLAAIVPVLVAQPILVITVAAYVLLKLKVYEFAAVAGWSLQALFALTMIALPYVALCAWLSALCDTAMRALLLSSAVIGGIPIIAILASLWWDPGSYLAYLLPWPLHNQLLRPDVGTVALASVACLLYTAIFAWLGERAFRRRDL